MHEAWEDQGQRWDLEGEALDDHGGMQVVNDGPDRNVGNGQLVGQPDFGKHYIREKGGSANKWCPQ